MEESELTRLIEQERLTLYRMVMQIRKDGRNMCGNEIVAQSQKLDELLNQLTNLRKKKEAEISCAPLPEPD